MNLKVTSLLGIFLLLLIGFVVFYEKPKMAEELTAAEAEKEFLAVTRQTVAKFTLQNQYGRFVAEKRGNQWHILEPVETPGDWEQFEAMVTAARAVERGRVIVDESDFDGADLSAFGLKPPRVELLFEDQTGDDIELLFGDDNPAGRAAYLSWSDGKQVVLTQRASRNRFEAQLLELRDKRILPFDLDRVQQIILKHGGQTFEMVRDGFKWQVVQPERHRGDASEINNILGTIRSERLVDVVAERFDDPTRYGFDSPSYHLTLVGDNGESSTLVLGKNVEDQRLKLWYAHTSERHYVFQVEPFMTDFLTIDVGDIRYKRVFEFERSGIDRIQLAYPDSTVRCRFESNQWVMEAPEGHHVTNSIVAQWIDRVHTMAVEDFIGPVTHLNEYGLASPNLVVSLWRQETLVREVSIGERRGNWYGKMDGLDEVFSFDAGVQSGLRLPLTGKPKVGIQLGAE